MSVQQNILAELTRPPESAFSAFFRTGQVLETFRGKGIYQPSVDTAIEKIDQGQWVCTTSSYVLCIESQHVTLHKVHLFGEGKVNQRNAFEKTHGVTRLPRFKWGV